MRSLGTEAKAMDTSAGISSSVGASSALLSGSKTRSLPAARSRKFSKGSMGADVSLGYASGVL